MTWAYGFDNWDLFKPAKIVMDSSIRKSKTFEKYWEAQIKVRSWAHDSSYYIPYTGYRENDKTKSLDRELDLAEKAFLKYLIKINKQQNGNSKS